MPTGTSVGYVAATTHRPIPTADRAYVRPHETKRKPVGLDWDALTPTCTSCGAKSGQLNSQSHCPTCAAPVEEPTVSAPPARAPRPAAKKTPGRHRGPTGPNAGTNVALIRRLYVEELLSIPEVSRATGHAPGTIRRVLIQAGIELRDDRRRKSGGRNRATIPPDTVDQVRRLYVDEGRTIDQVADVIGRSSKYVRRVMTEHDIPVRPDASRRVYHRADGAAGLKQRLADLDVTARQVKEWALSRGLLMEIPVGLPPARLVEAYADAHRQDGAA